MNKLSKNENGAVPIVILRCCNCVEFMWKMVESAMFLRKCPFDRLEHKHFIC